MANRTRGVVVDRRPGRRLYPPTTPLSPVVARVLSPTASIISDTFVPTQEQRAILEASFGLGDVVKIDATAGSGKTSVLRSLVHIHANRGRVLYLVFSKALQIAERNHMTCPAGKGVTVLTLDALAAQHTAELHGGRVSSTLLLSAEDVRYEPPAFAKAVADTIDAFANSVDHCVGVGHAPSRLPLRSTGVPYQASYVAEAASTVWSRLRQGTSTMTPTHAVRMKLFQLYHLHEVCITGCSLRMVLLLLWRRWAGVPIEM